ncbi:MAG: phenylacetate--CoA ligase family protein [Geminicoccaceae bacterium]
MTDASASSSVRPGRPPAVAARSPTRLADAQRALVGLWAFWQAGRAQWRDPGRLREWQARRLRSLVRHAYETVPFYRRLYDQAGVVPAAIRSLDDLECLPVITKAQLQREVESDLLSRSRSKESLVTALTSGSTGRPFRTYRDAWLERWRAGYLLRALATAGYRLGDRLMIVVERPERPGTGWTRWRKLTFHDRPDYVLAEINRLRPSIVYGYVSALRQVVRLAREQNLPVHRPRAVVTVSETLDPVTRQQLADGFGAPVFDIYGSIEMGVIAWECEAHDGYHVAEDSVLVETLPADGGGERLVLTNLHNEAMPLIRYDQSDLVKVGTGGICPCGRRFRRLEAIQGRVMDAILRPDGSHIPPFAVTAAIREIPGVRRFQIVQERADRLTVRIEGARPLGDDLSRQLEHELRPVLGPAIGIGIEPVPTLEPPPGVKFRLIESRIPRAA